MKRFLTLLIIFSLLSVPAVFAAEGESTYTLDDTQLTMTGSWSRSFLTSSCYNGTAASGSSGASFTFDFFGTEFAIYGLTYQNSSSCFVYIDGVLQGRYTSGTSVGYVTDKQICKFTGLDMTDHTVTVVSTGDNVTNPSTGYSTSGRLYIDYITYQSPVSETAESGMTDVLLIFIFALIFINLIYGVWKDWRFAL